MCYVTQTQDMCTIQTCHEHMMLEKQLICGVLWFKANWCYTPSTVLVSLACRDS